MLSISSNVSSSATRENPASAGLNTRLAESSGTLVGGVGRSRAGRLLLHQKIQKEGGVKAPHSDWGLEEDWGGCFANPTSRFYVQECNTSTRACGVCGQICSTLVPREISAEGS